MAEPDTTLAEIFKGPPYTPRATWPKVELTPVQTYKTRLERGPQPTFTPSDPAPADNGGRGGDLMLRAVRSA